MKRLLILGIWVGCLVPLYAQNASNTCIAPADVLSTFVANGTDPSGMFEFDYWVESRITVSADGAVNQLQANYYINSADGSMLFPQGFFFANAMEVADSSGSIDNSLWMSNGQMVIYAFDSISNLRRALIVETNQTSENVIWQKANHVVQFLTSSSSTAAPVTNISPDMTRIWGNTDGFTGRMSDGVATIYFASRPDLEPIKTSTPLMGFLVGVLKDEVAAVCNRLAVFSHISTSPSNFIIAELMSITPRTIIFDGSPYKITTLGGAPGTGFQNNMAEFTRRMEALYLEKESLKALRRSCTDDPCYDRIDSQLEALEDQIDALNCEIAKSMGVEETIDGCL